MRIRNWVVALVLLLTVAVLAACGPAVAVPERDVDVSVETALAAQEKAMMGVLMGQIDLTESELSSLLSVLNQQNSPNSPIQAIHVWTEPGNKVVVRAALDEGVIPFGNSLDMAGTIGVMDNHVMIDLDGASVGNLGAPAAVLDMVSAQINAALADPSFGVAADVDTGDGGSLMVGLGG